MSRKGGFILGGLNSRDYGIIMTKAPPIVFAERDVENISAAGCSGDLTVDKGRYKNVSVSYECAIIPQSKNDLRETGINATALLQSTAGYKRLENTFSYDSYRMARISSEISVESLVERAGKFTINFDCKPQRFLKSGDQTVRFTAPGVLRNPTAFPAKPLITVRSGGPCTLTVGGTAVEIKDSDYSVPIVLDCEIQNAYCVHGGTYHNVNNWIYAPKFPELLPGDNEISWDGVVYTVDIIPRWWTL